MILEIKGFCFDLLIVLHRYNVAWVKAPLNKKEVAAKDKGTSKLSTAMNMVVELRN